MKKTLIALLLSIALFGCGTKTEQPTSFETPVPSVEEIETSGNPFEEESVIKTEINTEPTSEEAVTEETTTEDEGEEKIEEVAEQASEEKVLKDRSFTLMPENSEFYWKSGKIIAGDHEGLVRMKDGEITLTTDKKILGNFTIDMNEIAVLDLEGDSAQGLIDHLKNDDFFSVEKFPEASFNITNSNAVTEDTFNISGDLTIKGITNPITFEMKFLNIEGVLVAIADINIDRTLWDIRYGSGKFFEDLGDKAIKDTIETKITLSFIPSELLE